MNVLDTNILLQAKTDLLGNSERQILSAALYFFLDGSGVDESNYKTFTALCERNGLNADLVAKAIWQQLPKKRRERVLRLLKEAGYNPRMPA